MTTAEKRDQVAKVPFWFHSHDFGDGVVVNGSKSLERLRWEWEHLNLPDLHGRTVLDVNTWDGWFALEAERRGAARVVGLDWHVWCIDRAQHVAHWRACEAAGTRPQPCHEMPYFRPADLPGKTGFDTARRVTGSRVEEVVGDFATMDLGELRAGFDVVLYLGTLYHMADPLGNLRRLYDVTAPGGLAVVETHAVAVCGLEHVPLWEGYGPLHTLDSDWSNWWGPNALALRQALLAAGFAAVEVTVGPPRLGTGTPFGRRAAVRALLPGLLRRFVPAGRGGEPMVAHYRAYAQARRSSAGR